MRDLDDDRKILLAGLTQLDDGRDALLAGLTTLLTDLQTELRTLHDGLARLESLLGAQTAILATHGAQIAALRARLEP